MTMSPNSDKCFKCFQQGHWAKDCPSSNDNNVGRGEAVSSATCGILKQDVNSTSSCICMPSKSDKCFQCQQPGSTTHSENDANSTPNVPVLPNRDTCYKCFQQGHWAKDCPSSNGNNVGRGEAVSSATCGIFKIDVNSSFSCSCMQSKSDKCFECQEPGHWAKDCPSMVSNSRGGPNSSSGYNIPQKNCVCGRGPCVILTSKTARNPGRKFYKCQECGFFEWCDGQTSPSKDNNSPERFGGQQKSPSKDHNPPERLGPQQTSPSEDHNPSERRGPQQFTSPTYSDGGCRRIVKGYDLSTKCPCGAGPCPIFTAKTQKNMGRQFVSCPVRKGEGTCGFFKWCDKLDSAASSSSSIRNSSLFVTSKQDDSLGRTDT